MFDTIFQRMTRQTTGYNIPNNDVYDGGKKVEKLVEISDHIQAEFKGSERESWIFIRYALAKEEFQQ